MSAIPNIPTLPEIRDRMFADVAHYLPGSGSRPYKSVLSVVITVFAGAIWSLYGFASWILKQLNPLTASEAWLKVWGSRLGVPRIEAIAATGTVTFTGEGEILTGTLLHLNQRQYMVTQDGVVGEQLTIEALQPGYDSNIPIASTLTLVTSISGVELTAEASPVIGGADQETLQAWAQRLDERLKRRQQIGDADDYASWARESHAAIRDAWVVSNTPALGDICIYCLLDVQADPAVIFPEAKSKLDRLRNVGGNVCLRSPESVPVLVRVAGVGGGAVQSAITAAITDLIISKRSRNAYLYPEEIERIVANYTSDFTLLAPVTKIQANDTQILNLSEVRYE